MSRNSDSVRENVSKVREASALVVVEVKVRSENVAHRRVPPNPEKTKHDTPMTSQKRRNRADSLVPVLVGKHCCQGRATHRLGNGSDVKERRFGDGFVFGDVFHSVSLRQVFLRRTHSDVRVSSLVLSRLTSPLRTIVRLRPGMFAQLITSATNSSTSASMSCARDVITTNAANTRSAPLLQVIENIVTVLYRRLDASSLP